MPYHYRNSAASVVGRKKVSIDGQAILSYLYICTRTRAGETRGRPTETTAGCSEKGKMQISRRLPLPRPSARARLALTWGACPPETSLSLVIVPEEEDSVRRKDDPTLENESRSAPYNLKAAETRPRAREREWTREGKGEKGRERLVEYRSPTIWWIVREIMGSVYAHV